MCRVHACQRYLEVIAKYHIINGERERKMKQKKALAIVTAIFMVLTMLPLGVFADGLMG